VIAENQEHLDVPKLVQEAHERTKDYLSPTPLEFSPHPHLSVESILLKNVVLIQVFAPHIPKELSSV